MNTQFIVITFAYRFSIAIQIGSLTLTESALTFSGYSHWEFLNG